MPLILGDTRDSIVVKRARGWEMRVEQQRRHEVGILPQGGHLHINVDHMLEHETENIPHSTA